MTVKWGVQAILAGAALAAVPALAKLDIAHVGTAPEVAEAFLKGFRAERVEIQFKNPATGKMEKCMIRFVMHEDIGEREPVLLLHGLTDTGSGFSYYVNRLVERKQDYKAMMWVDWPRHGLSECDQVRTMPEASQAVYEAFRELQRLQLKNRQHALKDPKAIVGHSMGTVMAAYLHDYFPNARYVLAADPLLNPEPMRKNLIDFIMAIDSRSDAHKFLKRTGKNPIPKLPFANFLAGSSVDKAMLERIKRSREVMARLDLEAAVKKTLQLDPERTEFILGLDDELTPPKDLHQAIHDAFRGRIRYVKCGHNIHRDCPEFLPERF